MAFSSKVYTYSIFSGTGKQPNGDERLGEFQLARFFFKKLQLQRVRKTHLRSGGKYTPLQKTELGSGLSTL